MEERSGLRRGRLEAGLAALAVIALGAVCLVGAGMVRQPGGYTPVPASVMPAAVGAGLLALGVFLFLRAAFRPDLDHAARIAAEAAATHWPTTLLALGALVAYAVALAPLGYVAATSIFVPAQARILGSRSPLRDVIVGIGLAVVVYVAFTRYLGVRLPAGLLEPLIP